MSLDKIFNSYIDHIASLAELHPIENLKVGQIYRYGEMTTEILAINDDGTVKVRMNNCMGLPNGFELNTSHGISTEWKLDDTGSNFPDVFEEDRPKEESPFVPESVKTETETFYIISEDDPTLFDAIDIFNEGDEYESEKSAFRDKQDTENVYKVTLTATIGEVFEEMPSFESELAELKKKYGKK